MNKRILKIIAVISFCVSLIFILLSLILPLLAISPSSIDIIGGADTPTYLFIFCDRGYIFYLAVGIVLLLISIILHLYAKK